MKLEFFHTDDSSNTINKTLTKISEKDVTLKASTDILTPRMVFLAKDFTSTINYMKMLDTYYFVDLQFIRNNSLVIVNSSIDVLETYKDIILNSQADVIKKSSAGNIKQENVLPTTISKTFTSDKTLTKSSSIIMITSGQPINTGSNNKDDTRG